MKWAGQELTTHFTNEERESQKKKKEVTYSRTLSWSGATFGILYSATSVFEKKHQTWALNRQSQITDVPASVTYQPVAMGLPV